MGLFKKLMSAVGMESSGDRFLDKEIYGVISDEINRGVKDEGLYTKAKANSGGDAKKAESLYLIYRAEIIKDEMHLKFINEKKDQQIANDLEQELRIQKKRELRVEKERIEKEKLKAAQKLHEKIGIIVVIVLLIWAIYINI